MTPMPSDPSRLDGPRSRSQRPFAVIAAMATLALIATGCGDASNSTSSTSTTPAISVPPLLVLPTLPPEAASPPPLDAERIASGKVMYDAHCAVCHGFDLRGDPNWQVPNEDGSFRPPPQDATGHTWHHPDDLLVEIIAVGSDFPQSQMPPFGELLSEDDILAILDYIKDSWGPQERRFQWEQTVRARLHG